MVAFKQGDVVWLDFTPQSGSEQAGRRPAVVISNNDFNEAAHFILVCPITSKNKYYPLHCELPKKMKIKGVVMLDQIKALDLVARNGEYSGESLPATFLDDLLDKITGFFM